MGAIQPRGADPGGKMPPSTAGGTPAATRQPSPPRRRASGGRPNRSPLRSSPLALASCAGGYAASFANGRQPEPALTFGRAARGPPALRKASSHARDGSSRKAADQAGAATARRHKCRWSVSKGQSSRRGVWTSRAHPEPPDARRRGGRRSPCPPGRSNAQKPSKPSGKLRKMEKVSALDYGAWCRCQH